MRLFATGFVLLLARRVGAQEFGLYSSALAYASLTVILVDLGTNAILTREIARRPSERISIYQSSHLLKVSASLGSMLLLWAGTYAAGLTEEVRYLTLCLGLFSVSQALTDYFSSLLSGIEEMGWEATLKTISRSLSVIFGLVPLFQGKPLGVIATAMAMGSLTGYGVSVLILKSRFGAFGFKKDMAFIKSLLKTSMPLFASAVFWILYESQDIVILNLFRQPQADIGYFASAIKMIDVLRMYPVLLIGVFFPALSKLHLTDPTTYRMKARRVLTFLALSTSLLAAGLYLGADWLIVHIYQEAYRPAVPLLQLLAPALFLCGINYTRMQFLIAQNRERKLFASALTTCLVNLAFAALLVPRFGVSGACYALLISEVANFIVLHHLSRE